MSILATIEERLGRFMDRQGAKIDRWLNDSQDLSDPKHPAGGGQPNYRHPLHAFKEMLHGYADETPRWSRESQLGDLLGVLRGRKVATRELPDNPEVFDKYEKRLAQEQAKQTAGAPEFSHAPLKERAERLLRAMIHASRCGNEESCNQSKLEPKLRDLDLDKEDLVLIMDSLEDPLDPAALAEGVHAPDEALELYVVSYYLVDADNPEGQAYLDKLSAALLVPDDVREDFAKNNAPCCGVTH